MSLFREIKRKITKTLKQSTEFVLYSVLYCILCFRMVYFAR
nr:MAG TPA: hypothetical protein [Caudoviricetes sp.]